MERYRLSVLVKDIERGGDIDVVIAADAQRALDAEREKVKELECYRALWKRRDDELTGVLAQLATLQAQLEALRQERDEARHSRDVFKSQMIAHMNDRDSYAEDLTTLQAQLRQVLEVEHKYRKELWLGHRHHGMYGDDGEMQCIECHPYGVTDYKRDPLDKVEHAAFQARIHRATQATQDAGQGGLQ